MILVIVVGIVAAIAIPQFAAYRKRSYDSDVKANLRNAATAQEAYFEDHHTYTSNIDSLKEIGYVQSDNVTMGARATTTTFVITGTIKKGCKANTGTWLINSTDGSNSGTPCGKSWSARLWYIFWWAF